MKELTVFIDGPNMLLAEWRVPEKLESYIEERENKLKFGINRNPINREAYVVVACDYNSQLERFRNRHGTKEREAFKEKPLRTTDIKKIKEILVH